MATSWSTPILISKHLILIDHQQFRPIPLDQPAFLGFERRYDHGRIQIFGKISRSDAHIPPLALATPANLSLARARVGTV